MNKVPLSKNKIYYPIIGTYLVYTFIYLFKDYYGLGYTIINNLDRIAKTVWFFNGLSALAIIINTSHHKLPRINIIWAIVLFLLFNPYAWTLAIIEFVFF